MTVTFQTDLENTIRKQCLNMLIDDANFTPEQAQTIMTCIVMMINATDGFDPNIGQATVIHGPF